MTTTFRKQCYFCEGRGQAPAWRTGLTHDSICPLCSGSGFADTSIEWITAERDAARALAEERAGVIERLQTEVIQLTHLYKIIEDANDELRAERDAARALAEERAGEVARLKGDKRVLLAALEWVHSAFSVYDRTLLDRTDNQRQAMDNLTETLRDIGRRAALAAPSERAKEIERLRAIEAAARACFAGEIAHPCDTGCLICSTTHYGCEDCVLDNDGPAKALYTILGDADLT